MVGDPSKIRTCDTRFRKPLLYPLSYGAKTGENVRPLAIR